MLPSTPRDADKVIEFDKGVIFIEEVPWREVGLFTFSDEFSLRGNREVLELLIYYSMLLVYPVCRLLRTDSFHF